MTRSARVRSLFLFAAAAFLAASAAEAVGPLQFYSVTPCRLADTRDNPGFTGGPILQHGVVRNFPVYGANARPCGIPADGTVKAVTINATVVSPSNFGHLTLFPYNTTPPIVSNLNYGVGEAALGNGAIVPITNDASFQISALPVLGGGVGQTLHLVIDVTGYFK